MDFGHQEMGTRNGSLYMSSYRATAVPTTNKTLLLGTKITFVFYTR